MITFLFWNTKKKQNNHLIRTISNYYDIDILIFVEFCTNPAKLLEELNDGNNYKYYYIPSPNCSEVGMFSRFSNDFISTIYEGNRFTIKKIVLPIMEEFLLVITHQPSKLFNDEDNQSDLSNDLIEIINSTEKDEGHSRTILVGDLNMNPFEKGVVGSHGLHAMSSRQIALKQSRMVNEREYKFFYNPTWKFLSDANNQTPGTYYYNSGKSITYYWNTFDQVLIRPDLLPFFDTNDLSIVTSDGNGNLLINESGIPRSDDISDHLPIVFKLSN